MIAAVSRRGRRAAAFRLGSIASESFAITAAASCKREIGTPTRAHCNFRFPRARRDASRLSSRPVLRQTRLRREGNVLRNEFRTIIYILIPEKEYKVSFAKLNFN